MPVTSESKVEAPQGRTWKPIPEDIYQVVIKDVEEKIMKKYQSEEEELFDMFKFMILDGTGDAALAQVSCFCSLKWFSGNKKASPSKLVTLVKAVYAFYYPNLSVVELEAEDMDFKVINDLIGKQLRIAVKLTTDGTNNKVTEFMAIKQELTVPDEVKVQFPKVNIAKPKGVVEVPAEPVAGGEAEELKVDGEVTPEELPF